jgi:hypothetical protein
MEPGFFAGSTAGTARARDSTEAATPNKGMMRSNTACS